MSLVLPFIRPELSKFQAYTPHPGGAGNAALTLDRLDTNENPYDLPASLKQELARIWEQEIESNRYPDGSHHRLKTAIASYVSSSATGNTPIESHQISVGNGSDELIRSILIATCLGGVGSILVAQPTFSMYGIIAQTLGIPVVTVDRSPVNWEINLAAAQQAIESTSHPPIRVVFVVHPNSPTANALTPTEIDWLRQLPTDILVVIDEAYFEFSQHTLVSELAEHPNWIVMRTFSKAFRLAAHRVGYAIAHPQVIATLEQVRLPYNLPSITLAAAELALQHQSSLLSVISEILDSRDRLLASVSQLPHLRVWNSDANFLYARLQAEEGLDPDTTMAELVAQLKRQGTLIRHTGGGLRITIGSPAENQRTLDRLSQFCHDRG